MSETPFLAATRASYDAVAAEYADWVRTDLDGRPVDRALLAVFADLVRACGVPRVADVGCGPGRVTSVLHRLGVEAFGIDLSPEMVALARRSHPGLGFAVGSMLELPLPDAGLGGLLAYYSIIHVPWELRPALFAEFRRVLVPGGHLMLGFQVGAERRHRDEAFGKAVDLDFYRQDPDEVVELLQSAGFSVGSTTVKQPEESDLTPQCLLLARRPLAPG